MQWHHGLPEEDGVLTTAAPPRRRAHHRGRGGLTRASATRRIPAAQERARRAPAMGAQPGRRGACGPATGSCCWSGSTAADLAWLRAQGWTSPSPRTGRAAPCRACAAACRCWATDPTASTATALPGPAAAGHRVRARQTVRRTSAAFGQLIGTWALLSGVRAQGYEPPRPDGPSTPPWPPRATWREASCPAPPGRTWGNVLGVPVMACSRMPPRCTPCLCPGAHALDAV